VRQSVSICEHLIERGGIALEVEVDPELPVIQAVAGQLEQVLINLITNAVHAVENGGKVGKVLVKAAGDGPASVLLEVSDSGPGVPEADRQKIFEPFFTTKPDGKGTGLGLPIVRNIVDQHGGEITVSRSSLGGAAFRVVLPSSEDLCRPVGGQKGCARDPDGYCESVMKPEVVLELLEAAADQLGIKVSYEPLQTSVVNGGLCRVKGVYRVIVDKRATAEERVVTLATALATFDTSELELSQKVREVLRMHEGSGRRRTVAA